MTGWLEIKARGRKIGYARVSTTDQRLDLQTDALTAIGCEAIYSDHGISGGAKARPGLDRALGELAEGDVLIVFKLDRLGRSVQHLADLLVRFDHQGIDFCSITEGINTTSSGGRFSFHLFAAVAELGRDIIRENTIAGLEAAKARGARLGRPPALSLQQARNSYRRYERGLETIEQIASRLGVSTATVRRAFARRVLEVR